MWEYNYPSYETSQEELYHYGVKGMKWGIRKAQSSLSKATTSAERDKAVAQLQKHRTKASTEIAKLEKKRPKLEKEVHRHITKNDEKAAKLREKSAKLEKKAYGMFTSKDRASNMLYKAGKLDNQAKSLEAKSAQAKARLAKNEEMQKIFKQGINDIDKAVKDAGKMKFEEFIQNDRKRING